MENDFNILYDKLKKITIYKCSAHSIRKGFGICRFYTFGMTRYRNDSGRLQLSASSKKYPTIHEMIFKIGKKYCPHEFNAVHLNNNVTCPPHKDSRNQGVSTVISFGEYTGGKLVIENEIHDAYMTPITFDGSALTHWNENDLVGNKYSLVFFNRK